MSVTPIDDLDGLRDATAALIDGLSDLTDPDVGRPSLCEGWTIGHVLTHLARNADGVRGMIAAAERGEMVPMYPSADTRAADIEAGAARSADALVADVVAAAEALDATWPAGGAAAWDGHGLTLQGRLPVAEMPFRRWREVEVHRTDLGLAFGWADLSDAYVARELADSSAEVGDDDPRQVVARLLGRAGSP